MAAQPWLPVTEGQALRFFFEHLRDIVDGRAAPESELLYNASVLAHFATTSTAAVDFPSAPVSLGTVFDLFVLDRSETVDPDILEAAASQCLLLTGFFAAQLRHRYNLAWYAKLGSSFFERAAVLGAASDSKPGARAGDSRARSIMMHNMAARFSYWRRQQARLAKELHDLPKLVGRVH
ncbi:MAG TPA: hypothetical protein VFV78_12070 [Vicinamibacterales bacterium]|nr:hypothetical protein [Vicinamibacterales bacterium]